MKSLPIAMLVFMCVAPCYGQDTTLESSGEFIYFTPSLAIDQDIIDSVTSEYPGEYRPLAILPYEWDEILRRQLRRNAAKDSIRAIPDTAISAWKEMQNAEMVATVDDVIKALELAVKYLPLKNERPEDVICETLEYRRPLTPAERKRAEVKRLEQEAKEIEQHDADVEFIRDVLKRLYGTMPVCGPRGKQ